MRNINPKTAKDDGTPRWDQIDVSKIGCMPFEFSSNGTGADAKLTYNGRPGLTFISPLMYFRQLMSTNEKFIKEGQDNALSMKAYFPSLTTYCQALGKKQSDLSEEELAAAKETVMNESDSLYNVIINAVYAVCNQAVKDPSKAKIAKGATPKLTGSIKDDYGAMVNLIQDPVWTPEAKEGEPEEEIPFRSCYLKLKNWKNKDGTYNRTSFHLADGRMISWDPAENAKTFGIEGMDLKAMTGVGNVVIQIHSAFRGTKNVLRMNALAVVLHDFEIGRPVQGLGTAITMVSEDAVNRVAAKLADLASNPVVPQLPAPEDKKEPSGDEKEADHSEGLRDLLRGGSTFSID